MKKIFTTLLITLLLTPFLSYSQVAGTTCANPIPLYPQTGCGNSSGAQYSGYYQMENAAGNMVSMTGTSTVNPGCTTDNETTQAVEWLEVTATATSFSINNETSYTGSGASIAEKRDYIVYSGTCGSLTQVACFSEVLGGTASVVTGLTVGQTYLIMVSQSSTALAGCATCTGVATCITSSVAFVPPNDICSGAFSLTTNVPFETTNANSTATAADGPAICQSPFSGSVENNVWFSWCAPSTWPVGQPAFLNVNSQICNSTQGLQLSVFGANQTCAQISAGTATSVICANPGVTTNYSYTFTPSANNCYYINIDGFAGTACTFLIQVGTSTVVCNPPTIAVNSASICGSGSTTLTATGATSYTWSPATGLSSTTGATVVANPTVTTVYTILGSASGCTGTSSSTVSINAAPTITPAGTNTLCSGSSTSLTVSGASTYTWSPSATLSSSTGSFVTATPTTNTTYTIIGTSAAGCTNSAVYSVSVTPVPTITVNSPTICSGTSTVLTASGGTTYSWTPGATLSSTSGTTVTASPTTTTIYTVTGTTNGCSAIKSSTVTVNPTPTISVNSASICPGSSTVLTASGGTTYSWSPGTNLSSTTGATVTANPTLTTVYTVTGTTNGCSSSNTSTVTINPTPTTTASTTGTLTCTNTSVTLNSTLSGVSYTWTAPAGGLVSSANTQSTSASGAAGTYTLNVQSAAGCTFSTTTAVTQNTTTPTGVNAGLSQTLTCSSPSVTLTGSVLTPTNATVNWTGPSVCGTATTLVTSVCGAGVYTLTATNPANGCTASATVQVSPSAGAPTVTNNPVTNTITCTNTLVTVSISTTVTPVTILWTGTGITSGNGTGTITVNQGGTFQYTVTNTLSGCSTSNNQAVTQNTTVPTTTASTSGSLTCSSSSTVGLSSTLSGMNYTWTAPAGGSVASANSQNTSASGAAGVYTLSVVNPTTGCTFSTTTSVSQNTTAPTTTASSTGSLTCSSSSTVGLSSTLSGMNYTWTAPAGGSVASANSQNTSASGAAGVYTLNVIDPATGCTFSTTTSVSQNTTVPTTTATTTGTITCTTSTVGLSSTLSGMNYTWTAPAGGSVANANSQNTSATGTGNYTLTVMDPSNNCTFTTTSTVTDNIITPTGVSAGSNQTLTCTSGSVTLNGSVSSPTNALLDWGTNVCGTQTTAVTTACAAGVYTLTATDPSNGCVASSTVEVFPNSGAPSPTISATALTIDCNNTVQSVTVTSTPNTDIIFNWNNTPFSASSDSSMATFNNAGTYICTVTNTISGCSTPIQVVVSSNTAVPTISITGTQTLTCSSPSVTISLTTTPTSGLTYSWSGGSIVSGQGTDAVVVNQLGVYTVSVTNGANGCSNTATTQVLADANVPSATVTASSSNSIITCQNTSVTLTVSVNPSATYSYTWLPSGGNSVTANVNATGVYTVVVLNASSGCSVTAQYTVDSNTTPPTVTTTSAVIPCGTPSIVIGATSTPTNVNYSWATSGTGTILSGSNTASPVIGSVGAYVVTATSNDNGCSSTSTVNVTTTVVNAAFTANPTSGTAPLLVNFTNQSTGATNYSWTFGDNNNNTSTATDPSHVYNANGSYTVTLTATDASSLCTSTATLVIEVFENSMIIVPNVFTPNGDGVNDAFKIKTVGIKDLNVDIFNRWGLKLYTIASISDSWDGGNAVDGTYFFILKATGYDGKEFTDKGYISLFR